MKIHKKMQKIENLRHLVEADYLSMYIKTWLAFLSSLHELYPDIIDVSTDKEWIRKYSEDIKIPDTYENEMRFHIEEVHKLSKKLILRDTPASYFGRFYKINHTYSYDKREINNHIQVKVEYRNKLNNSDCKNLFIRFKSSQKQFFQKLQKYCFEYNIKLQSFVDNHEEDNTNGIIDKIRDELIQTTNNYIDSEFPTNISEKGKEDRKDYVNEIIKYIIQNLRQDFKAEYIFEPLPITSFPENYDTTKNQKEILEWFIMHTYQLRNILFHYIIDTFDREWLKLFKHTFYALNVLLVQNMEKIKLNQNP